ncbi:hypothetical protein GCM10027614_54200 [Micromonospora vulcania]
MAPCVRADVVEHLAGFPRVEPARSLLGGVGRPAYRLTGQPGVTIPFRHRAEFPAEVPQPFGGPPLLRLRLVPKLSACLTGQLPGLSPRLGGHLAALLGRGVCDLATGLRGLLTDLGDLLTGLLPAAGRWPALIRCRHAPLPSWVLGRARDPERLPPTRRAG